MYDYPRENTTAGVQSIPKS